MNFVLESGSNLVHDHDLEFHGIFDLVALASDLEVHTGSGSGSSHRVRAPAASSSQRCEGRT